MVTTINLNKELAKFDLLIGGYGPEVEAQALTNDEEVLLDKFIKKTANALAMRSPELADIFSKHTDMIRVFAEIFKAKTDNKTFGGELPSPGKIGIKVLQPLDVKYSATAPTDYDGHTWVLDLTAGTKVYLLGSDTEFYKSSSTTGSRTMMLIFKDGIVEYGTVPKVNQFRAYTEKVTYAPFTVNTLVDKTLDRYGKLFVYETPFAIPVWYDFGVKLEAMPQVSGTSDLRLMGVVFYEYNYFSDLVYR